MALGIGELFVFLALTAIVGSAGLGLGIFFLAPRITRLADRSDEESRGGDD